MTKWANEQCAIIILAAGQSSRLGQMKQLVTVQDKSLVEVQLEQALKVSNQVYCVLGFKAEKIQARIDHLPVTVIINRQWSTGLASSIAAGVKALASDVKAVMLVLVDQWQLTSADLIKMRGFWQDNPHAIVVAHALNNGVVDAREKIGPPVVFPQHYFLELAQLSGQEGAKPLLNKYQQVLVKVTLAHAFIDLDTPEHLNMMNKIIGIKPSG